VKKEEAKNVEHRVRTQWPFTRISEADLKLLKKIKTPKQPLTQESALL